MTYVYVARSEDFIKIGHSCAPRQRVHALMTQKNRPPLSKPLELVHATPGDCNLERRLHSAANPYRVHGREFFTVECLEVPEIKEFLDTPRLLGPERYSFTDFRSERVEAVAMRMKAKGRAHWFRKN